MVHNVNNQTILTDINPVGGSQPNSPKVTENQTTQFENSVQKLQENFLNDAKLLKASRKVRNFGDIFTADMSGKKLGRIVQFFTNIGLYFTTPEKLLRNTEKNIDALQQLLQQKADGNEKITSAMLKTVTDCIQKADASLQAIGNDETIPQDIRQNFKSLYKKEIFQVRQHNFLETVANGIALAEKLTEPENEADFDLLKELADKIDTCNSVRQSHPSACRENLFTLLFNQFSRVTDDFLGKADIFITSVNDKLRMEATQDEYEALTDQFHDFTAKIRPFYDALTSSGKDNEPQCLKDFKVNCQKTFNRFSKALDAVKNNFMNLKYRYLAQFPFLEKRK